MKLSRPYTEFLDEQLLARPGLAMEYLNNAIQSDDPRDFIVALSDVARAYGMSKLASQTSLGRTSLYKALSKNGNPQFTSIASILDAVGLRLKIESKTTTKTKARKTKTPRIVQRASSSRL